MELSPQEQQLINKIRAFPADTSILITKARQGGLMPNIVVTALTKETILPDGTARTMEIHLKGVL